MTGNILNKHLLVLRPLLSSMESRLFEDRVIYMNRTEGSDLAPRSSILVHNKGSVDLVHLIDGSKFRLHKEWPG